LRFDGSLETVTGIFNETQYFVSRNIVWHQILYCYQR